VVVLNMQPRLTTCDFGNKLVRKDFNKSNYIYKDQLTMKIIVKILLWILVILFFPLSLIFVAYFRQQKSKKEYWDK